MLTEGSSNTGVWAELGAVLSPVPSPKDSLACDQPCFWQPFSTFPHLPVPEPWSQAGQDPALAEPGRWWPPQQGRTGVLQGQGSCCSPSGAVSGPRALFRAGTSQLPLGSIVECPRH